VYSPAHFAGAGLTLKSVYEKEAVHVINAHSTWDLQYIQYYGLRSHFGKWYTIAQWTQAMQCYKQQLFTYHHILFQIVVQLLLS